MPERRRKNPTEYEAWHPGELTKAEEAHLVRRVATMQNQMRNRIERWVDSLARRRELSAKELLVTATQMSDVWRTFVLDPLDIEPRTYEQIVRRHARADD